MKLSENFRARSTFINGPIIGSGPIEGNVQFIGKLAYTYRDSVLIETGILIYIYLVCRTSSRMQMQTLTRDHTDLQTLKYSIL